jgi:hypothetical protein
MKAGNTLPDGEVWRIEDDPDYVRPCAHPQHEPPRHICIPPGQRLRHRCPGCGRVTFVYSGPTVYM